LILVNNELGVYLWKHFLNCFKVEAAPGYVLRLLILLPHGEKSVRVATRFVNSLNGVRFRFLKNFQRVTTRFWDLPVIFLPCFVDELLLILFCLVHLVKRRFELLFPIVWPLNRTVYQIGL